MNICDLVNRVFGPAKVDISHEILKLSYKLSCQENKARQHGEPTGLSRLDHAMLADLERRERNGQKYIEKPRCESLNNWLKNNSHSLRPLTPSQN